MDLPTLLAARLRQRVQETPAILVILEDWFPAVTATCWRELSEFITW